jgi:hypothetical protein
MFSAWQKAGIPDVNLLWRKLSVVVSFSLVLYVLLNFHIFIEI